MNNRPLAALSVARRNIMPKIPCKHYVIASILLCAVAFTNAHAQNIPASLTTPDTVETRPGTLNFRDGMPDAATTQKLYDELDYIRAVDAFINGYPGVSQLALRKGFIAAGINDNDVPCFRA